MISLGSSERSARTMFSLTRFIVPFTELGVPYTEVMVCLLLVVKGLKRSAVFRGAVMFLKCTAPPRTSRLASEVLAWRHAMRPHVVIPTREVRSLLAPLGRERQCGY